MAESKRTRAAIGIDLGTSNSRVGIWLDEEHRFEVISNDRGKRSTPSYVAFTETERLIGDAAKNQVSKNPAHTVFDSKRLIGRKFSDLSINSNEMRIQWPFRVACGLDGKPMIHVEYKGKEKVFSADEVYSMLLGKMKDLAEVYLGSVVDRASVSVPHCFNSAQRQAIRCACSIAGLETVTLVSESICAALAYTLENDLQSVGDKRIMVFDLGGGSLDVTLLNIEERVIEVKATSGDGQLGGEDFDLRLVYHFIQEIQQKYERDVTSHPRVVRRLKNEAERVKLALSSEMETTIQIDSLLEDFDFYSSMSRVCFEEMNMDLFKKCMKCVEDCLQNAQVDKADVNEVLLIGGSSHIPKMRSMLAEFFSGEAKLNKSINPDEAVVLGAAARCGISYCLKTFSEYLLVDVTPFSLGLEIVGGVMHVMHPRNTSIPKSRELLFTTVYDDQDSIFFQIYEGESTQTHENELIATFELPKILPAPHGVPQILVRFYVDACGILTVTVKDKTTGGKKVELCLEEIDITSSGVNHDIEHYRSLPIQVYHPLQEIRSEELSELLRASELSTTAEGKSNDFSEFPQSDESRIFTESLSQEFPEQVQVSESSVTIKSRSQSTLESSRLNVSSNALEKNLEGVTKIAQVVDEFGEPYEHFQELELDLECHSPEEHQSFKGIQQDNLESARSVDKRSAGAASPGEGVVSAKEDGSQEVCVSPQEDASSNIVEDKSIESFDLPEVYESCIAMEVLLEEFCDPTQVFGTIIAEEGSSELQDVSKIVDAVERVSREFPELPESTSVERRQEISEMAEIKRSSNLLECKLQGIAAPPKASELSYAEEIRSRVSVIEKIIDTIAVLTSIKDFKAHKKECFTLIRRVKALALLFDEFKDGGLSLSEKVFGFFEFMDAVLNKARSLLLLCKDGCKIYLILELRKLADKFLVLNTEMTVALQMLPALDLLEIAEEVKEQVQMVQNQFQRSKVVEDPADAELHVELISALEGSHERSKHQLERLAGLFNIDSAEMLMKEAQALHDMKFEGGPDLGDVLCNKRGLELISELLDDFKILFSQESQEQDVSKLESSKEKSLNADNTKAQPTSEEGIEDGAEYIQIETKNSDSMDQCSLVLNVDFQGLETSSHNHFERPLSHRVENTADSKSRKFVGPSEVNKIRKFVTDLPTEVSEPSQATFSSNNVVKSGPQELLAPSLACSARIDSRSAAQEISGPRTCDSSNHLKRELRSRLQQLPAQGPSEKLNSLNGEHAQRVDRLSETIGSRPLEASESLTLKELSIVVEDKLQGLYDTPPAQESHNDLQGCAYEYLEPLPAFKQCEFSHSSPINYGSGSASGSLRCDSGELVPAHKSSNASMSGHHEAYECSTSNRSSSTSDASSEELSGTLRGDESKHKSGDVEPRAHGLPRLHTSATTADSPQTVPVNARSASWPQIRSMDSIFEDPIKNYHWGEVLAITDNWESKQLGKGGFGAVFLGKLQDGREVAVKVLDASSQQGTNEFLNEVNLLKRVNHVNLVRLLGYCQEERQVLIYEFAEEGSIWDHLQVGGKCLDWKQRLNIALQSACGLEYLHTGCSPRIIHRDIKSQNILLTKGMVAKVADFGLSKLGSDQDNLMKTHITTMVKGTVGYLDPEYLKTGQLTEKSDVYSFGVVLLEILTGRKPINNSDKHCFIGNWVETQYSSGSTSRALKTVADPSLSGHYNPKAMKLVLNIAQHCIQPNGTSRPDMTEVVRVLRKAQRIETDDKKSSKSWLHFL